MRLSGLGNHRIIYASKGLVTGLTVRAYIWDTNDVRSGALVVTEIEEGLYCLEYDFDEAGLYMGVFFEDGYASRAQVFRVDAPDQLAKLDSVRLLIDLPFSTRETILRGYLSR